MSIPTTAALDRAPAIASTAVCRHCGEPCGDDAIASDAGPFCCAGCQSVFLLLTTHGLDAFYRCDIQPGRSQRSSACRDPERFATLDVPSIAQRFVIPIAGGRLRATFHVPDIHCASCLWLLERLWRFDPGVGHTEADILSRVVRVDFDPAGTSLRAIAERLASLGYEPLLDAEAQPGRPPASRRRLYLKIGVAGFAFGNVMLFSIPRYVNGAPLEPGFQRLFDTLNFAFAVPVLLYSAAEFFQGAWRGLRSRSVTLDVPIAIGLAALFGRSLYEIATQTGEGFFDSFAGLVFFLLIGRLLQQRTFDRIAFDRTVRSFLPLSVFVDRGNTVVRVPIEQLSPGDVVVLRPGEVVPADATLLDGRAHLDYAFVTGEQLPVAVSGGEVVRAGGRVAGQSIRIQVRHEASRSELARLWTNPVFDRERMSRLDRVLSRFGQVFTVSAIALAAAGAWAWWPDATMAAQVATAVLIIACPCAFTLAAPLTLGTTAAALGRAGLFLKRPAVALDLARAQTVVFDKTGTLTTTDTALSAGSGLSADDLRRIRRLAAESAHPVSRAIAGTSIDDLPVDDVREVPGGGITGRVDGHAVVIGSAPFVSAQIGRPVEEAASAAWVSVDGRPPVGLRTPLKERPGIDETVASLAREYDLWLLSGDHATAAHRWRPFFGTHMRFRQSPADKLTAIRDLQRSGRRVLMVGDGLNDAGALAAADVGLAVSDDTACLVPACDAVIQGDRVRDLPALLVYTRRAPVVLFICFAVSLAYNVVGLTLALTGRLTPLATAVLMPVSSLTIIALAAGLMRFGTSAGVRR